jgi:hypothetical protein
MDGIAIKIVEMRNPIPIAIIKTSFHDGVAMASAGRFSPLGLRGMNHFPEGGSRHSQIEHWNGKRSDKRRNQYPTPWPAPPLLRKKAGKYHRRYEQNQKRYVHRSLLLCADHSGESGVARPLVKVQ